MTSPQQTAGTTQSDEQVAGRATESAYEPPAIRRLGTLSELTLGGGSGPNDGFGGAGAMGSIGG
jgi:hypothetical protein